MLVKQETIIVTETITDGELLNQQLEKDIRDAGYGSKLTTAKCYRTRWDMHEQSKAFRMLGNAAIGLAQLLPLATRTNEDGTQNPVNYKVSTSWGLIYGKGQFTNSHTHWPDTWSWTYCVSACEDCSPLVFTHANHRIIPEPSQMIIFPGWLHHEVPIHTCDHERIMIAGNLVGY